MPDHYYPIVFHNHIVSLKYLAKKHLEELRESKLECQGSAVEITKGTGNKGLFIQML